MRTHYATPPVNSTFYTIDNINGGERVRQGLFDFLLRAEAPLASLKAANAVVANNNYAFAA